jgi:hypothetical protein
MKTSTSPPPDGLLSERQQALIDLIRGLDPDRRHTLTIECRGSEPWRVAEHVEHRDTELRPR